MHLAPARTAYCMRKGFSVNMLILQHFILDILYGQKEHQKSRFKNNMIPDSYASTYNDIFFLDIAGNLSHLGLPPFLNHQLMILRWN